MSAGRLQGTTGTITCFNYMFLLRGHTDFLWKSDNLWMSVLSHLWLQGSNLGCQAWKQVPSATKSSNCPSVEILSVRTTQFQFNGSHKTGRGQDTAVANAWCQDSGPGMKQGQRWRADGNAQYMTGHKWPIRKGKDTPLRYGSDYPGRRRASGYEASSKHTM